MFGRTPLKFDFAKMTISEISAIKQKVIQNPNISFKIAAKLISARQNFAKLTQKCLGPEPDSLHIETDGIILLGGVPR